MIKWKSGKEPIRDKKGRTAEMIQYTLGNKIPRFHGLQGITYPDLNASQNEALSKVNAAKDIGLIKPSGTGKTTTLVTCIKMLYK